LETLRVAIRALFRNKLRSFLTTLGMIFGVGAVVATVAIGEGARSAVEEAFASMGTNLLVLLPGSTSAGGARGGFGTQPTLTWEDLKAIQTEVPTVRYGALPPLDLAGAQRRAELDHQVGGTGPTTSRSALADVTGHPLHDPTTPDQGGHPRSDGGREPSPQPDPWGSGLIRQNILPGVAVASKKGQNPNGRTTTTRVPSPAPPYKQRSRAAVFINGPASNATTAEKQVTRS
jgi:hypothetical protein